MMNGLENLNALAHGALSEKFGVELNRVMKNILDPNTKATAARTITLKMTLKPTEDRATVVMAIEARSTPAPATPAITTLLLDPGPNGSVIATEVGRKNEVAGQLDYEGHAFSPRSVGLTLVGGEE